MKIPPELLKKLILEDLVKSEGLPLELTGNGAIWNPTPSSDSSPRQSMLAGNVSQFVAIHEPQPRRFGSAAESLFVDYCDNIIVARDCKVVKVLNEYVTPSGVKYKGSKLLIVEYADNYELDLIPIDLSVYDKDLTFTYNLVPTEHYHDLYEGKSLAAGTILADSPMKIDGNYCFTREANIVYGQFPWNIEDGIGARRGWLKGFTVTAFGKRHIPIEPNTYLLNLYGNDARYQALPEPGQKIRSDGLVACYRECDELFDHALMGIEDVKHPHRIIDKPVYGNVKGRCTRIKVRKGNKTNKAKTGSESLFTLLPQGMETQLEIYDSSLRKGASDFLSFAKSKKDREDLFGLNLSDHITNCYATVETKVPEKTGNAGGMRVPIHSKRSTPLPQWDIHLYYEYDMVPNLGFKLTAFHGNKGVLTHIWEDEDGMHAKDGTVVDLTQDTAAVPKRTCIGAFIEHFVKSASDTCSKRLREMHAANFSVEEMWNYLMRLYELVNPFQHEMAQETFRTDAERMALIEYDMNEIYWINLPDNMNNNPKIMGQLVKEGYKPFYDKLILRSHDSHTTADDWIETENPMMVGKMSFMMLEKIGSDSAACADIKIQSHGLPAKTGASDKYTTPFRDTPLKTSGETETRHRSANADAKTQAEFITIATDPAVTLEVYKAILRARNPSTVKDYRTKDMKMTNGRGRALIRQTRLTQGIVLQEDSGI